MMTKESEFVTHLAESDPLVAEALAQHLADNDGELLPYLFLGDVTLVIEQLADRGLVERAQQLLAQLEGGVATDDSAIANLVAVSFVEGLSSRAAEQLVYARYPLLAAMLRRLTSEA